LYAYWRIASSDCHASSAIADRYLYENRDAPDGLSLAMEPKEGPREAWLGVSLTMLVLASLAADRFDPRRRRRTRLKQIAREVGTPVRWQSTALGLKRQAAYRRDSVL
jgi:hypothetical protein